MRRVRYSVAMSLDGYIAGPKGEYDWILMDPDIDFQSLFKEFDTVLMGRKSFEVTQGGDPRGGSAFMGMTTYVFSRTIREPTKRSNKLLFSDNPAETVTTLKQQPGKDIWLFGGGSLFKSLLERGLVDSVEPAVIPVLLGGGIPLLPTPAARVKLTLTKHRVYEKTGTMALEYAVNPS